MTESKLMEEAKLYNEFNHKVLIFKVMHADYMENKLTDEQINKMFKLYETISDIHGKYSRFIVGGDI